eukprot:COSAG06_NODE_6907_length_2722_cov_1.445292_1_plen_28_part_10
MNGFFLLASRRRVEDVHLFAVAAGAERP